MVGRTRDEVSHIISEAGIKIGIDLPEAHNGI